MRFRARKRARRIVQILLSICLFAGAAGMPPHVEPINTPAGQTPDGEFGEIHFAMLESS